jgi:hypothetical protein
MLFGGVTSDELTGDVPRWEKAQSRALLAVDRWQGIVGIELNDDGDDKLKDESLFRVLEWGGMESVITW